MSAARLSGLLAAILCADFLNSSVAVAQAVEPNAPLRAPPAKLPPKAKPAFAVEPIADAAVLSLSLGVAALSEAIIGTGEITPQQPNPDADFLAIDRASIGKTPIAGWGTVSNIGIGSALAFAVLDPVQTAVRDSPTAGLVDAVIYAETLSTTWALTNVTKIAFRRPRPSAYVEQARLDEACAGQDPTTCVTPSIHQTDSALSFFSGHAALTAAVFTTGTYLAFARSPNDVRPWLVLGAGAVITTLVDVGRVQAGKHFPTDVIAGSLAGIGVGVIVPHLHRRDTTSRAVWVGFEPRAGGATLTLNGIAP